MPLNSFILQNQGQQSSGYNSRTLARSLFALSHVKKLFDTDMKAGRNGYKNKNQGTSRITGFNSPNTICVAEKLSYWYRQWKTNRWIKRTSHEDTCPNMEVLPTTMIGGWRTLN